MVADDCEMLNSKRSIQNKKTFWKFFASQGEISLKKN